MPKWLSVLLQALSITVALFVIGLLTRIPALAFYHIYALHALLAAPLYAVLVSCCTSLSKKKIGLVFAASLIYGLVLGSIQIIMGISVVGSVGLAVVVYLVVRNKSTEYIAISTGTSYGFAAYPTTLLAGLWLGSYSVASTVESLVMTIGLILLGAALSFLGALLGSSIGKKLAMLSAEKSNTTKSS